jgi:hypothetical protein
LNRIHTPPYAPAKTPTPTPTPTLTPTPALTTQAANMAVFDRVFNMTSGGARLHTGCDLLRVLHPDLVRTGRVYIGPWAYIKQAHFYCTYM